MSENTLKKARVREVSGAERTTQQEMIDRAKGILTEEQIQLKSNANFRKWIGDTLLDIAKQNKVAYKKGLIEGLSLGIIGNAFVYTMFNLSNNYLSLTNWISAGICSIFLIAIIIWYFLDVKKMVGETKRHTTEWEGNKAYVKYKRND